MLVRLIVVVGVFLCFASLAVAAPPPDNAFRVDVGAAEVAVSGVTPGGEVVLFGVTISPIEYSSLTRRHDVVVTDSDRDGRVTHPAPRGGAAVWIAVDSVSGQIAAGVPPRQTPEQFDFPANGLKRAADGKVVRLEEKGQMLEFLVVRPGAGAWAATAYDGGRSDTDRRNDGSIQIALEQLTPLAGGPAPAHLRGSDIVVVIDADSLRYAIVRGKE